MKKKNTGILSLPQGNDLIYQYFFKSPQVSPICSLGGELQDLRAVRSGTQEHSVVLSQTLALFLTSLESLGMLLKLRALIS